MKPVVITKRNLAETSDAWFIPLPLVECYFKKALPGSNIRNI